MKKEGDNKILLAHHKDDIVENIFDHNDIVLPESPTDDVYFEPEFEKCLQNQIYYHDQIFLPPKLHHIV